MLKGCLSSFRYPPPEASSLRLLRPFRPMTQSELFASLGLLSVTGSSSSSAYSGIVFSRWQQTLLQYQNLLSWQKDRRNILTPTSRDKPRDLVQPASYIARQDGHLAGSGFWLKKWVLSLVPLMDRLHLSEVPFGIVKCLNNKRSVAENFCKIPLISTSLISAWCNSLSLSLSLSSRYAVHSFG